MICYKDMTFCAAEDCKHFGAACHRSLTKQVINDAARWWGSEDAPIGQFTDPKGNKCYEPKETNEPKH